MPKQDSRVTADEEDIEGFHIFVASNAHADIEEMLEENPTLVYARDEHGNTALYYAVAGGREANLETARILMNHGAEPLALNPQGRNVGWAIQLIDDLHIQGQMGRIVGIHFNDYSRSNGALERSQEYFVRPEMTQVDNTLNQIASSGKKAAPKKSFFSWNVQEITYDQDLTEIFKKLPALNMDEQKKFDQMSFATDSILKGFSFHPMMFETASSSNDLSIVIIPKEIVEFGYEQFTNLMGKLYDFCLGSASQE